MGNLFNNRVAIFRFLMLVYFLESMRLLGAARLQYSSTDVVVSGSFGQVCLVIWTGSCKDLCIEVLSPS